MKILNMLITAKFGIIFEDVNEIMTKVALWTFQMLLWCFVKVVCQVAFVMYKMNKNGMFGICFANVQ